MEFPSDGSCVPAEEILKKYVPESDSGDYIQQQMKYTFTLNHSKKPVYHAKQCKIKRLSAKTQRISGVYKINKTGKEYSQYLPLNQLWNQYISNVLQLDKLLNYNCENGDLRNEQVALKISKADLHGCLITVTASTCPSYVGTTGIVLQETRHTFVLIMKSSSIRTIPKAHSEFTIHIGDYKVLIYGNHFRFSPGCMLNKHEKSCVM